MDIILSEVIQSQKNTHDMHSLISGYEPRSLEYPRYNLQNMKVKKTEDQRVDALIPLRRGNKIPMEGVTEIKCGAEIEGMVIQRLPYLRIHPIYNH